MSISKGFLGAFEAALAIGGDALQIFTKSPRGANLREISDEDAGLIADWDKRDQIRFAVIHASYLLNLAKPFSKDAFEFKSISEDLRSADKIGAAGAVLHIGKTLKEDPEVAEKLFVDNVAHVLEESKGVKAHVILEDTAGQGTEMGYRFDHLGKIFKAIGKVGPEAKKRLSICIDTQHMFAAGYDIRSKSAVDETLDEIEKHLGLENITVVHFNDSKKVCGARVDRHQDVGKGEIGAKGLEMFAKEFGKRRKSSGLDPLPFILETPQEHTEWSDQIKEVSPWL